MKTFHTTLALLLISILLPSVAGAVDGVLVDFRVYQDNPRTGEDVLLLADTAQLVKGMATGGYFLAFSVDLVLLDCDTSRLQIETHAVTLSASPKTYARRFSLEYGLPARLDSMEGKNGVTFSFQMTPLMPLDIDTAGCSYSDRIKGTFKFDPSAYIDIYYVPNSMGDFYWNSVKGYMGEQYEQFHQINRFTLPGKYVLHLCPCAIPSVVWDSRFGTMVDPTRSAAYALYSRDVNTADPFIILHAAILRNYGYAPLFLSEGFAGYLSFARYDMQEIIEDGRAVPLRSLLDTYTYLGTDPEIADRTAASFVRYLVDEYKIDRFRSAYAGAHDLNLAETLESEYGKVIEDLEQDWRHYLDTLTFRDGQFEYYAELSEILYSFDKSLEYSQALLSRSTNETDSLTAMREIVRAHFLMGSYYDAADLQTEVTKLNGATAPDFMALGSYNMMNGEYDKAGEALDRARALDPDDPVIQFNRALNHLYSGDMDIAKQLLRDVATRPESGPAQVESKVMLASVLFTSGDPEDAARAERYCHDALVKLTPVMESGSFSAVLYVWAGIAFMGVGDTDQAHNSLQAAYMLETRPFYQGMISLWLGKLADALSAHDEARNYYGRVLATPSADYHQREARTLLDAPPR